MCSSSYSIVGEKSPSTFLGIVCDGTALTECEKFFHSMVTFLTLWYL